MAKYEDFSLLIGRMKRAAIDCWMADNEFYPTPANPTIYAKWGWMLNFYNRPGDDGSGGGDGNGVTASVETYFDEIRAAIDNTVARWQGLPDGAACDIPRQQARSAAAILGASGGGDPTGNGGEIGTANNTVHEVVINQMKGSFRAPFIDKYYTQFTRVHRGLADASMILEANYTAEKTMWPAARSDAAQLCQLAIDAWTASQQNKSASNTALIFTAVTSVAGAVSSVVTAGAGGMAAIGALSSIAGAAATTLQGVASHANVQGTSYNEILNSLTSGLDDLNSALKAQERALETMLNDATSTIHGEVSAYNLDAFSLGEYLVAETTMSMERSDTQIVTNNMYRIEDALNDAVSTLHASPESNPTPRSGAIGIGESGTHVAASELWSLTSRCLSLTAEEYARGHALFEATVNSFFLADASAVRAVAEILASEALTEGLTS